MQVFICYSRKDRGFVDQLVRDLNARGVMTWRDVDRISGDVKAHTASWRNAIDQGLRESTHMIVVLSPDCVASSEATAEWNYFLSTGKPVLPVQARTCEIPYRLYSLQYYDLRSAYEQGLDPLVAALTGEAPTARRKRTPTWMLAAGFAAAALLIAAVGFAVIKLRGGGPPDNPVEATATAAADRAAVEQAVIAFDTQMRRALETGNITGLSSVARGVALQKRLDAVDLLERAGNCYWIYDQRGITVTEVTLVSETRAEATANVDRDGRVFCDNGERTEYAFEGPYTANYVIERFSEGWLVTDYEPTTEE